MAKLLLLAIVCQTLLLNTDALVLIEPVELYLNSPSSLSTGPREFNFTRRIVVANPIVACSSLTNQEEIRGNIALVQGGSCNLETQALLLQAAGAVGVIVRELGTNNAGINQSAYSNDKREQVTISVVFLNTFDGGVLIDLIANSSQVIAIVASGDANAWKDYRTSVAAIVLLAIHCVIDISLAAFAIYKLVWYFQNKNTKISVAQMSLALLIFNPFIGVAMRVVNVTANHGIIQISSSFVLGAIFVPLTLLVLAALIVSFYWFEITTKVSSVARTWSRRLWAPFLTACGILVALLIVVLLWAPFFQITLILIILLALYAAIVLTVSIIWIVFGAKVHRALHHNTAQVSQKNSAQFKKLTALIILCACFLISMCLTIALGNIIGTDPITNAIIFELAQFFSEGATAVIIFIFSTKKKRSSSSENSHSLQNKSNQRQTSEAGYKADSTVGAVSDDVENR